MRLVASLKKSKKMSKVDLCRLFAACERPSEN